MAKRAHLWLIVVIGVVLVASACVPPSPLPETSRPTTVVTGTVVTVTEQIPEWRQFLSVTVTNNGGLSVDATPAGDSIVVTIAAPVDAAPQPTEVAVLARGCRIDPGALDCPDWERQDKTVRIPVMVVAPGATIPEKFLDVDPQRWQVDDIGQKILPGELLVYAHFDTNPTEVAAAIGAAGGAITGAWTEFGYYQARFADTAAAAAALAASPLIETTAPVQGFDEMPAAEPADWSGRREEYKWTFRQAQAVDAWEIGTGSDTVQLGIIDSGIYPYHHDLRGVLQPGDYTTAGGNREKAWRASNHGTHVAGTMCSTDGSGGLVGVSQKCRLHALDTADVDTSTLPQKLQRIDTWLNIRRSIRVVNISSVYAGTSEYNGRPDHPASCSWDVNPADVARSDRLFEKYSNTLFVVAAGNCGSGGPEGGSKRGVANGIPQANDSRTNVLTVAATATKKWDNNTGTWETRSPLANYSATDAEIAAPGGEASTPVWSSVHTNCTKPWPSFGRPAECTAGVGKMQGTSMAAPFVSGTAGLMLAANPDLTVNQLAVCLQSQANTTEVYDPNPKQPIKFGLREVNVVAAVNCAKNLAGGTYTWEQIPDDAQVASTVAAPDGSHIVTFSAPGNGTDGWVAKVRANTQRPYQGLRVTGRFDAVTVGPDSTAYTVITDPESSGSDIVVVDFEDRTNRGIHRYEETTNLGGKVVGRSIEYIDGYLFVEALAPNAFFSCHTRLDKFDLTGAHLTSSPNSSDCGAFWEGTPRGLATLASVWDTAQVSLYDTATLEKKSYSEYNGRYYSPSVGPDGRWAMYAGVNWWANNCGTLIELNETGNIRRIPGIDLVPEGSSCNFQSIALDGSGNTMVAIGSNSGTLLQKINSAGNVTTIDELSAPLQSVQIAYDGAGRLVVVYTESIDCAHADGNATCATLAVRTYNGSTVESIRTVGGSIGNSHNYVGSWSIADGSVAVLSQRSGCVSGPSNCWEQQGPAVTVFELPVSRQAWHDPATTQR